MALSKLEGIIESLLFAWGNPIGVPQLSEICGRQSDDVRAVLRSLSENYLNEGRGLEIIKLDDKYQLVTASVNSEYVRSLLDNRRNTSLSPAALEILAITAYNQPVTRAYIEQVRGVDCSSVIHSLIEKELLEEKGKLDAPGKPLLYGTTANFLRVFNISSLAELPELSEVHAVDEEQVEA